MAIRLRVPLRQPMWLLSLRAMQKRDEVTEGDGHTCFMILLMGAPPCRPRVAFPYKFCPRPPPVLLLLQLLCLQRAVNMTTKWREENRAGRQTRASSHRHPERVCVCVVDIGLEEEWRRIQREHRSPLIRLFTFLFVNVLPSISSLSSSAAKSSVACVSFSRFCVCVRSEMVAKGDAKERKKERRVKRHYFPVLGATRAE